MSNYAPSILAILLYTLSFAYLLVKFIKVQELQKNWVITFSGLAIAAHILGLYHLVVHISGYDLGFFIALSLVTCVVNLLVAVSGLRLPILNLFIFLFPFSAIAVLMSLITKSPLTDKAAISAGLFCHIALSILAYALLTISALHALFLAWQNHQLRHKHATGRVRLLPPLQTMEALLFDIVWAGQITLTLSIVSGFIFLEDMFAQHLVHKTVLSMLAWVIYSILLFGRHFQGWRGNYATRWTLAGFCTLMLAYFGSKLVIELILGRQTL
ncbi:inner membrane protein YpjD [Halioxenophilus sp. WMMB6]|uniref:cytochrome C assembly family protein n=1 Tax=Halioxenophilus sp. WMMB6 TaxID=3073815 RepID=UPI00295EBFAB|nr:cytochrome c biogenesis protein CcsA [Halioxenophilus sp. WMMB6]